MSSPCCDCKTEWVTKELDLELWIRPGGYPNPDNYPNCRGASYSPKYNGCSPMTTNGKKITETSAVKVDLLSGPDSACSCVNGGAGKGKPGVETLIDFEEKGRGSYYHTFQGRWVKDSGPASCPSYQFFKDEIKYLRMVKRKTYKQPWSNDHKCGDDCPSDWTDPSKDKENQILNIYNNMNPMPCA